MHKKRWTTWREEQSVDAARRGFDHTDLLLLQEACAPANDDAIEALIGPGRSWAMATSFVSRLLGCGTDRPTGVMTASIAPPIDAVALRSEGREFGLTPKSALATTYALAGHAKTLLVVNAHLLNFEWFKLDAFQAQLDRIEALIANHTGPLIIAGDLNTRNTARQAQVTELARRCGLRAVFGAAPDRRARAVIGGDLPLDHVLYRGLRLIDAGRIGHEKEFGWSDHNSVSALFVAESGVPKETSAPPVAGRDGVLTCGSARRPNAH